VIHNFAFTNLQRVSKQKHNLLLKKYEKDQIR